MNDTEQRAYIWLQKQGHNDITFHRNSSPDFVTGNGAKFEVKKVRNNVIWFSPNQMAQLARMNGVKVIIMDGVDEPVAVFPFSEIRGGFWNGIKVAGGEYGKMVNIRLDGDLWHQAKVESVRLSMTLQEWLTIAILKMLGDVEK